MNWFINKILDALEPRLEKLVRAAVDEAVKSATTEVEQNAIAWLKKIPLIGELI